MRLSRLMTIAAGICFCLSGCISFQLASSPAPEDLAVEILLCKKIDDKGELYKPVGITSEFSSMDKEIICYLSLKNIHKAVRLNWKWYLPDRKLFQESKDVLINAEEEEVETLSAFDRITLPEEGKCEGQWIVAVFLDRELIARKSFQIEALEKDKKITEDDKFNGLELLQKIIDDYSKKIEETAAAKEKEILER